jgi:Uma2 family endonuclease
MKNPSISVALTYRDILALPDDLLRHELINGEHIVSPAPSFKHQATVGNLYFHLRTYLKRSRIGEAILSPFDVVLSEHNMVEPDLLYISNERTRRQMNDKRLVGPPDLAVEVLSPSSRALDEHRKLRLYGRFTVPEYWLIDPDEETVRVYRLQKKSLILADWLPRRPQAPGAPLLRDAGGRPLTTPLLPGFSLSMKILFGS